MSADEGGWVSPMEYGGLLKKPSDLTTVPLNRFKGPPDPLADFLTDLRDRVAAIEARQRANGQHDPACPRLLDEQAQAKADWQMGLRDCTCWLRADVAPADSDVGRWQPSKVEYVSLIWVWHNGIFKCGESGMTQGQMHRIISEGNAQVQEWYDRETNTVTTETPEVFKGWGS